MGTANMHSGKWEAMMEDIYICIDYTYNLCIDYTCMTMFDLYSPNSIRAT
jgi:hypothetical protein